MTLWQAVVLGFIQGLTEFLPISSTAHLRIVPALLGWNDPGAAFTAVIQLGTLVAVLLYFARDIAGITRDTLTGKSRFGWMIALGTVPVVVCGLLFKHHIETNLRSLYVISGSLIALAAVLWIAELVAKHRREMKDLGWFDAIVVGLAQCVALIPGASRSGVTITGGLFMGLTRETAARFSFLLSLPAVFAAGVYELIKARHELLASQEHVVDLIVATVVSFIVGYACIAFLLRYLKTHTTYVFIIYRLLLGGLLLALLASGRLQPL
jgi:undecaprenyl-diphosphatase